MNDDTKPQVDPAVEAELKGVPEDMIDLDHAGEALDDALGKLKGDLEAAKQDILYAKAETQNVRRRLEKDVADARTYAATGFARDILSVSDNLARALDSIPAELREDDKLKSLIIGLEATGKELESAFRKHGIEKFVSVGEALDPNKHQAMIEMPSATATPGTIVQELQVGYMIKDRLLRPALVAVAKAAD